MICAIEAHPKRRQPAGVGQALPRQRGVGQEGVGDVSAQRQLGAAAVGPRGRRSKFTPEIRRQVGEWIDQQPDLSLHELQSRLLDLGLSSSIGRLWSLLRPRALALDEATASAVSASSQRSQTRRPSAR